MQVQTLTRTFSYAGVQLADPGTHYTPEQVKVVYAPIYGAELLNAVVEAPVVRGGKMLYAFKKSSGNKG